MFWESVIAGLKVLTCWETYIAVLEYVAIFLIQQALVNATILFSSQNKKNRTSGLFAGIFVIPDLFRVMAVYVFILTLSPIMLGVSGDAAWSFPWKAITLHPSLFILLLVAMVGMVVIVFVVPFIRALYFWFPPELILGSITLIFVVELIISHPDIANVEIDYIPEFWFLLGFLALGGIISRIGRVIVTTLLLNIVIDNKNDEQAVSGNKQYISDLPVYLINLFIGGIFGFIPVFIYGAWLGIQLKL